MQKYLKEAEIINYNNKEVPLEVVICTLKTYKGYNEIVDNFRGNREDKYEI